MKQIKKIAEKILTGDRITRGEWNKLMSRKFIDSRIIFDVDEDGNIISRFSGKILEPKFKS